MQADTLETAAIGFADPGLLSLLDAFDEASLDAITFGVVRMDLAGVVTAYNAFESEMSGLSPSRVVGRHFFSAVAPCTNNYMVAWRFETEPEIDSTIDYMFTLGMRPTRVRLRLLKAPSHRFMYLLAERR